MNLLSKQNLHLEIEKEKEDYITSESVKTLLANPSKTVQFLTDYYEILNLEDLVLSHKIKYEVFEMLSESVFKEIMMVAGLEFVETYHKELTIDLITKYRNILPAATLVRLVQLPKDLQELYFEDNILNREFRFKFLQKQNISSEKIFENLTYDDWEIYVKFNSYIPMTLEFFDKYKAWLVAEKHLFENILFCQPITYELCKKYFNKLEFNILKLNSSITDKKVKALIAMNTEL